MTKAQKQVLALVIFLAVAGSVTYFLIGFYKASVNIGLLLCFLFAVIYVSLIVAIYLSVRFTKTAVEIANLNFVNKMSTTYPTAYGTGQQMLGLQTELSKSLEAQNSLSDSAKIINAKNVTKLQNQIKTLIDQIEAMPVKEKSALLKYAKLCNIPLTLTPIVLSMPEIKKAIQKAETIIQDKKAVVTKVVQKVNNLPKVVAKKPDEEQDADRSL